MEKGAGCTFPSDVVTVTFHSDAIFFWRRFKEMNDNCDRGDGDDDFDHNGNDDNNHYIYCAPCQGAIKQ